MLGCSLVMLPVVTETREDVPEKQILWFRIAVERQQETG